eukprot:5414055-Pleurochrysis_carterae.AAC.1
MLDMQLIVSCRMQMTKAASLLCSLPRPLQDSKCPPSPLCQRFSKSRKVLPDFPVVTVDTTKSRAATGHAELQDAGGGGGDDDDDGAGVREARSVAEDSGDGTADADAEVLPAAREELNALVSFRELHKARGDARLPDTASSLLPPGSHSPHFLPLASSSLW